jgi:thiamine biosynthesis lipoprotein
MKSPRGVIALSLLAGCILPEAGPLTRFEFVETHMATPCEIKLYAASEEEARSAAAAAYAEMAAIDESMNDWKADSEISRLSRTSGRDLPVSDRLFDVLEASLRYSELSDGAFDVTVGPIVKLWRQAKTERKLPDPSVLRKALDAVGYRHVTLHPDKHTVRLEVPGMSLDVGGIAKGYACDRALAILKRRGLARALVNTGGGMAFGDPPPGKMGWNIQVADTDEVLVLSNCGVATSGDWERFVTVDGKRYSHIVDPKTGLGLTNRALVTVVAPTGMAADALTKCVMVPGAERGLRLAESLPGTQAWMRWEEGGLVRTAQTRGFTNLLRPGGC